MTIHVLTTAQELPIDLDQAWSFFSDPRNLPRITPPWLALRITSQPPARIFPGLVITYTLRPLPLLRTEWVTEISHVCEGSYFVDEQRLGPYRFWHHLHRFEPVPGGTRVVDVVHYALPLGVLTEWLHEWAVRPRLREIFRYRRRTLRQLFGEPPHPAASDRTGPP